MTSLDLLVPRTSLQLAAKLETALCVGAGGSSGSLADKPILRRADKSLVIPGSQVKGRLRHQCERLARSLGWPICESPRAETMCPQRSSGVDTSAFQRADYAVVQEDDRHHCLICQIFGNPALPSRVIFEDLICAENMKDVREVLRPGVTLNRRRRTAEDDRLYFLETTPVRAGLRFVGQIRILESAPEQTRPLLIAALFLVDALGGSKSAGLGWLKWDFDALQPESLDWSSLLPGGGE